MGEWSGDKRREVAHEGEMDKKSVNSLVSQLEKEGLLKQRIITTTNPEGNGNEMKKIAMVMGSDVPDDDPEVSVDDLCEVDSKASESVLRVKGREEGGDKEEVGGNGSARV